jgi:hypothetical protein
MTSEINSVDNPRGARRPGGRMSRGAAWEDLPEALHVERTDAYRALLDQGLRLNQIANIRDPLVREAIINLVAESVQSVSG